MFQFRRLRNSSLETFDPLRYSLSLSLSLSLSSLFLSVSKIIENRKKN